MTRTTITLLFSKDQSNEPPGILQCDTSGEYYPHYFYDWRDAIHYINWRNSLNTNELEHKLFHKWSVLYGYDEDEKFNGNLNEFRTDEDEWMIFTSIGTITCDMDLNTLSAWTFKSESDNDSDSPSPQNVVNDYESDSDS